MRLTTTLVASVSLFALAACEDLDSDFRGFGGGFNTTTAAQKATERRPAPDDRGILSYPGYQVAVARRGDTVTSVASRIGIPASELAARNAVPQGASLNAGEVLLLPRRVSEPSPATGAVATGPIRPPEQVDVAVLADGAISRAEGTITPANTPASTPTRKPQTGQEPIRHVVKAGETAYSISRRYGVSVQALDDWNGLDDNRTLRVGQTLLIPPEAPSRPAPAAARTSEPGQGSPTPTPPSAAEPLPKDEPPAQTKTTQAKPAPGTPESPDLGSQATTASASSARFTSPVQGNIIRAYSAKSDGIDIAAPSGAAVKAADSGTVAAITQSTEKVPILVLRHAGGLLTVYANVDGLTVKKGDKVSKGQTIAKVRAGSPSFLHFEVRDGLKAVDPAKYLP
ncbi:MAG: LysM peptidoglycan-binding domain-containing protein [Vannielia sp.]|uniref:LysM peptidoglycan-binding domain-containing protein n=1 Tax=Rhodobacterales TaxID=204455 RepID=UPI0020960155|nr:LysM peptidoglycan-binding domain-containing protein [Oceanicola sp. 502str15]MCO6382445.1 LysM peptidoglycan-binding domain-containing protein [Oceanicola sp. 502str15]